MDTVKAQELMQTLPESARVVDVGGGAAPFPRADYVIDALAYTARSGLLGGARSGERFSGATWVQRDLCDRTPWPFADQYFDFAVCAHVLEDVRDPLWVCAELIRVARAGYIETPSRILEQTRGVEHPCYAGYYHHRWLITVEDAKLVFRFKPHSLHSLKAAIVAQVGVRQRLNPRYAILTFAWQDRFEFREELQGDEAAVNAELCAFAAQHRNVPDLTVPDSRSFTDKFQRWIYYQRLKWQARTL